LLKDRKPKRQVDAASETAFNKDKRGFMTLLIVCGIGTPNGFGTEGGIQKLHGQNFANFEKNQTFFDPLLPLTLST